MSLISKERDKMVHAVHMGDIQSQADWLQMWRDYEEVTLQIILWYALNNSFILC